MCKNMKELQTVSEKIFELEQKKAKKKKEVDALEKEIKQKNELTVAGLTILFTAFTKASFDKEVFIADEGEEKYKKYLKDIPVERVTIRLAKN